MEHRIRARGAGRWGWSAGWAGLALALGLALGGCGGGGSGDAASTPATDSQATIDSGGGSIAGPDQVSVSVPAGAASAPMTIRIAKDSTGAPALPGGARALGAIYQVTPHDTPFETPVTVSLPYDAGQLHADEQAVVLQASPGKPWTLHMNPRVDAGALEVDVTQFSYFTVAGLSRIATPSIGIEVRSASDSKGTVDIIGSSQTTGYADINEIGPLYFNVSYSLPGNVCDGALDTAATLELWSMKGGISTAVVRVQLARATPNGPSGVRAGAIDPGTLVKLQQYGATRVRLAMFTLSCAAGSASWAGNSHASLNLGVTTSSIVPTVTGGTASFVGRSNSLEDSVTRGDFYKYSVENFQVVTVGVTVTGTGTGGTCPAPTGATLTFTWPFDDITHEVALQTKTSTGDTTSFTTDVRVDYGTGPHVFTRASLAVQCAYGTFTGALPTLALVYPASGAVNAPQPLRAPQPVTAVVGGVARFTVQASPGYVGTIEQDSSSTVRRMSQWLADPMRVEWWRSVDGGATYSKLSEGTLYGVVGEEIEHIPTALYDMPVTDASLNGALVKARLCGRHDGAFQHGDEACTDTAPALLTVPQGSGLPSISQAPASVLVTTGQTASFTAVAKATPAATLQWQKRAAASSTWSDVVGATSGTFTTPVSTLADNGTQWRLVATNAIGSTASAPATLSVSDVGVAPSIGVQPGSLSVGTGGAAVFAASASGTAPLSYQWRRNGQAVSGANSPVLTLATVSATDSASRFDLVVSNGYGSATTSAAVLTVTDQTAVVQAPSIAFISGDLSVPAGNTAMMAVSVSGTGPFTFQWWKEVDLSGYSPIAGATQPVLSLPAVGVSDATTYSVVVTGPGGSVNSGLIRLSVTAPQGCPPSVSMPQQNVATAVGGTAIFVVTADGSGPFNYQWQRDGVDLPGQTSAVLQLGSVAVSDAGSYSVSIAGAYGNTSYTAGTLTVIGAPVLAVQPADTAVQAGLSASFTVVPQSTAGVYVIWLKNGEPMVGETGFTLTVPAVALADTGTAYRAVLFNSAGIVFSSSATLTVTQPVGLVVSNLAGSAAITTVQDGQGAGAGFWFPRAVAYAPDGTLYVADAMYIRKVLPDGTTSTLAGCGFNEYADGIGANACFSNPNALTVDAQGNVWVADTGNCTVRKVTPAGVVTTPFNATLIPGYANCANLDTNGSTFNTITGIALRPNGNVIISNGYQIFEVSLSGQGILATVGTFAPGFANGRSDTARFNGILSIVLDANGNLYMADQGNDAVRLWNYGDGSISTLAGGTYHLSFDGVGALAGIHGVSGVAVDSAGMVYLCDSTTVRKVPAYDGHTPSQVTRVAGQFSLGSHVDGDALTVATFTNSPSLAVGPGGIIAVADPWEHRIRVIH